MASFLNPIRLSPLEAFMPRTYVRQMYCFPTSNPQAVDTLRRGVVALAQEIPYILSCVIREESGFVVVSKPCQRPEDIFSCRDLSTSINYASLRVDNFPPAAFLHPEITPRDALPPFPDQPAVFAARASLVEGGLILCVAVHHYVTDITGFGSLLKVWASCCRDESPSDTIHFSKDWMNREPLFASSDPVSQNPELDGVPDLLHIKAEDETTRITGSAVGDISAGQQKARVNNYKTAIFYFPQHHLQSLKSAVNAHLESLEPGSWASTGDILGSLLWSAIAIEATEAPLTSPDLDPNEPGSILKNDVDAADAQISTLSFPVQFRSLLRPKPLPADFLGAAFIMTSAKILHGELRSLLAPIPISSDNKPRNSVSETRCPTGPKSESEPRSKPEVFEVKTSTDTGSDSDSVVNIPILAKTTLTIRHSIQAVDDVAVRRVLSYLETHPPSNANNKPSLLTLGPPRRVSGGSGVTVVSWADQGVYDLSWGTTLGKCEAVRLPKLPSRRDPIVLPRRVPPSAVVNGDDGGGLEVIMSYEEDVMQRLIECPVMQRFAVLRCLS